MWRATLKSLLARKVRLVLSGLAVVLGVMFVSGAFVLTDTLSRSFDTMFSTVFSETDVSVSAKPKVATDDDGELASPPTLPADMLAAVRAVPGVAKATGQAQADGARVIGSNGKVVTTFGAPRFGENWTGESGLLKLRTGRGPAADDEIAVNAALADAAKIKVGDRVGVLTLAPKRTFTLVGTFGYSGGRDTLGGAMQVMFTEPVAQQLMLGQRGVYSSIDVKAAGGVAPAELRDRVTAALGDGYVVKTGTQLADENAADLAQGLSFFNKILLGFAGVALFVGIFLILNTFSILIAQRTRELALMRALGASRRQMLGSVLAEAVAIGLIASVVGLGAGIGVGAGLGALFAKFGGGFALAGIAVPPAAVISSFTVGVLITVLAAVLPALRASRIPPIAAMQEVATPDRPLTRLTVSGAVLGAVGGTLLALGLTGNSGDNTLWTLLGGVLVSFIGVALLTPLISRPVVSVLGRLFSWSVPGKLGRLNSGRNPRRTAITAAALMVGIALITGVNVIVDSAKSSMAGLVTDTLKADLLISGDQSGPRPPTFDPAVLDKAATLPGVAGAVGIYEEAAQVDGERRRLGATTDLSTTRDVFGLTPIDGTLADLGPDQLVLDSVTAKELGVAVGRPVRVQLSRGSEHTYTVAGVYGETELFDGIVLPRQATADFGIPQPMMGFLQLTPGTATAQVLPSVERLLADSPEVNAVDRSAFLKQQTGGLDNVLVMIQLLLGLAILIAVLGIVNTLALSVLERTRELGLLRAIGLGRAQTMRMVTVEATVISVFGALLGLAVGAGLGAAVVRALESEGITDLVFPWQQMGIYLGLAAVVGVVAAVAPAVRAARLNVLGAIAHE
ncbi:putative ABC transport system permease protein [Krasilnikovia cinnamomea]|uniref:Putative ABC transport system permease protein n=1 Tax=Krasilnikovia cinnamomea TaxID=349313 RepID=A0A4Q7ZH80_9ACTN|nr:ABC transporter permease [Krasilnikovia cinnamomea]RZU49525.1 putative ABC transport system permease protein [Krasilnikovia cinnamomea]